MEIFISFTSSDKIFANRLATSLRAIFGNVIWVYFENNLGGMKWPTGVQEGLDECRIMVLVVSPLSMASRHVQDEWMYYYVTENKPIIPVLLHPIEKWPYQLDSLVHIDFHAQDYDPALGDLCAALEHPGIRPHQVTSSHIRINRQKTGNLFWLVHDMMELHRWLLSGVPKEWIDVGFRQSCHHAQELGLDTSIMARLRELRDRADGIQATDWGQDRRAVFADEVKVIFNIIAQDAQGADPDFDSGPG